MRKPSKWESPQDRELREAETYLAWEFNPCGKPKLRLRDLERFPEPKKGMPSLAVQMTDERDARDHENRRAMLVNLSAAWHHHRAFPGELAGYYEGPGPGGVGWVVEIYGAGEPWAVQPAPPKPRFMQ